MKIRCGEAGLNLVINIILAAFFVAAAPGEAPLFRETFDKPDAWRLKPSGGAMQIKNGVATFRDLRKGRALQEVAPPAWTVVCKGNAAAGSYLEARVKAPRDVKYLIDLVNASNQSVASIPLSAGTGEWQTRRAVFSGQFGSAGDDLFVRVVRDSDEGNNAVEIDSLAIYPPDPNAPRSDDSRRAALEPDDNLALSKHECFVLSSSFADVGDNYTDNLIDGKPATIWRSWLGAPMPQWIELRWEYPIQIDQVWLVPASSGAPQKFTVHRWENEQWVKVKSFDAPVVWPQDGLLAEISPITTDRLRVSFEAADGDSVQLAEMEVYGPDQPLVYRMRPYWKGHYIWHFEPSKLIPSEPRYFRKTFVIDDVNRVASAFVQARSNDGYTAYVNGAEVARGAAIVQLTDIKQQLISGRNCIAFAADVRKDPGWPLMTLLADVTINFSDGATQTIATDETWKSSTSNPDGWQLAAFDDGGWPDAFICATPPDEPWGRIPYFEVTQKEQVRVEQVKVTPAVARPGDLVTIEARLHALRPLQQDYAYLFRAGEMEINSDRQNFVVAKAIASNLSWNSDQTATLTAQMRIPSYAPSGATPVYMTGLGLKQRAGLDVIAKSEDGSIATIQIDRGLAPAAAIAEPGGRLRKENGVCKIVAGGEKLAPFLWALQSASLDRFDKYSAQNIHLYHLQIYPYQIDAGVDFTKLNFAFVDQHIRHLLRIDPTAQVLVEMDLRESRRWAQAHPDDRLTTAQGQPTSASFASPAYRDAVTSYVKQLVEYLHAHDYRDRIIGYIAEIAEPESAMGGYEQNAFQADRLKLNIGDYNPLAIEVFREFLRRKYAGSVDALRAAWRDDAVTFETASPKLEELTREGEHGGVFRDPTKGRMPFDYFECLSTMVPTVVMENVGKVIKQATGGRALVGTYYGYTVETMRSVNNPGALLQGNHFYFNKVIDSPYIDFFMSPLQYENRMAGDKFLPFQPLASIRLHDKLYIAEEDIRTYISGLKSYGRQRSIEESIAVLQNHLGTAVIGGTGAWMADWSSGSGHARTAVPFFAQPELLSTIKQMKRIYDQTLDVPRTSSTRIAVFVSDKTQYYHDVAYASVIYQNLIMQMLYEQLPYVGAPFDIYMMEDVEHAFVQDQYKLYVFLNSFYMDPAQRNAVEKLKRDGKTLLFFYAPGYVSNERGLSVDDVAAVTGIHAQALHEKQKLSVQTLAVQHPLLQGIESGRAYVAEGFDYAPETARVHPTAIGPRLIIDDNEATVLARYADGKAGWAARDFGQWKSVYMTVPYLDTAALRNIAQWAGVHLYTDPGVIVEACDGFVLLHNGFARDRKLDVRLPRVADVYDLLTDRPVAAGVDQFHVELPRCRTLFYQIK